MAGLIQAAMVPNIILNPGFCDSDDQELFATPFLKRYNHQYHLAKTDCSDSDEESEQSEIIPFKRKLSIFFTEGTVKRM